MNDWHARTQRSQHLARSLAELGCQCVYINPHLGLEYREPYLIDPHSKIASLEPRVLELHVHLPCEHAFYGRLLTLAENLRLMAELKKLIASNRIRNAVSIVSFPIWSTVAEQLRELFGFKIVYDCHDWLPGFSRIASHVIEAEESALESANLVSFSSKKLLDDLTRTKLSMRSKALLVRNGVDPRHFQNHHSPVEKPLVPTVGYVGALDHWFDVEAVKRSALDHPAWKFVLVGGIENPAIRQLSSCANIEFIGEISYREVPKYLASWDVGIIPFRLNKLTLAVNPIKLYEYFSGGLPVVSSRLPEVELFEDLVYIANSPAEFSSMLPEAISESDPALRLKRMQVSRQETWAQRAQLLLKAVTAAKQETPPFRVVVTD